MSGEAALRVFVLWAEQRKKECEWWVRPQDSHLFVRCFCGRVSHRSFHAPDKTFMTLAHVSRWFWFRLRIVYEEDFARWFEDTAFVKACLDIDIEVLYTEDYTEMLCVGPSCGYCDNATRISRLEHEIQLWYDHDHGEGTADEVFDMREKVDALRWHSKHRHCTCTRLPSWKTKNLRRTTTKLLRAIEVKNAKLLPESEIYYDPDLQKICVWEDPDPTGYYLDRPEELACAFFE